ncbi:MAG: 3-dehydroquinate dehydratase [Thermoleophilia bacterium]|nr:3-dehydroquinate dehydratase [Thermoleophilia bacterium]
MTIYLLHGCNLDMLGRRRQEHYGGITLQMLENEVVRKGRELGMKVRSFQTNHEGDLVEKIHELVDRADGIVINPGAWTHYSYAIRDALEILDAPVAEVHLSDIYAREEWRRRSVISDVCAVTIAGKGLQGYVEALEWLAAEIGSTG